MASYDISSGSTVSGVTLNSGNAAAVDSGGSAVDITVASAGAEYVYSGGNAVSTVIESGGLEFVFSGGSASATDVGSGGSLVVVPGGSAVATSSAAGAAVISTGVVIISGTQLVSAAPAISGGVSGVEYEFVLPGGTATSAVFSGGAEQVVEPGGVADAATLGAGGTALVSGLASGTVLQSGGAEAVVSGGVASATSVASGASLAVGPGGSATGATIASGGFVGVASGASASGTDVTSGGILLVLPGGVAGATISAAGAVVASAGFLELSGTRVVSSGTGAVSGLAVPDGDVAYILPGGSAVSAAVSGGELLVYSGGVTSSTQVVYGSEYVDGGVASFTTVSTGYEVVDSSGVASGTTVISGEQYVDFGGSAVGAVISSEQFVDSGGRASATTLVSGNQYISAGGFASDTVLSSGSYETVSAGGSAAGTTIGSGALVYVYSGGSVSGTHVQSAGVLVELPHGSALATSADPGGIVLASGVAVLSGTSVISEVSSGVLSGNTLSAGQFELVLPQGTALSAVVGADASLYDYALVSATTVSGDGELDIEGGGSGTGTVLNGGVEFVYSGGSASGTTVSTGYEAISGGIASGTVLLGGDQYIYSGGIARATTVGSASFQFVSSGGTATGTVVNAGGTQAVAQSATVSATTLNASAVENVGGVASGTVLSGGAIAYVLSGGLAAGDDVKSGGVLVVLPGGSATDTTLEAGSVFASAGVLVLSGAVEVGFGNPILSGQTVTSGETEYVLPGGSAVSAVISSGGTDVVYSGGVASGDVLRGGNQAISSGGSAVDETISSGTGTVYFGALAVSTTVSGGVLYVSGGDTSATVVSSGGEEYDFSGVTSGTTVSAGGAQDVDGGIAIATTISAGGTGDVFGTAISAVVLSGGLETIDNTGTGSGIIVDSGGEEVVYAGTANSTALAGTEIVSFGGREIGGIVGSGANLYAELSGTTSNVVIGSGGFELVYSGATATGTDVQSGGTLVVLPGGSAVSTTVATGGTVISTGVLVLSNFQLVSATSGTLSNFVVSANRQEIVLPQGATVSSILMSGGVENVESGGVASLTAITSSGTMFVYAGGTATFATVSSGGQEIISSGGLASATSVGFGGSEFVLNGGVASATIVNGGSSGAAYEIVSSGGTARATTLGRNGYQLVSSGAVVTGTTVSNFAVASVGYGGVASNTFIFSGGIEMVAGIAIGTTIEAGGGDEFYYGGVTTGTVVSSGGLEDLEYGTASGTTIESGGKEVIEGGTATDTVLLPGGTIALYDFTYSSGGTASLNSSTDLLTVSAGGQTYTQQLAGDYSGESFHFVQDPNVTVAPDVTLTPCYCRGTRIATPDGEVAIEGLRIGDPVLTAAGESRPIRWIGRRSYDGRFAAGNHHLLPVLVRRDALGENVPVRDLYVSPNHAIYVDGLLIPASLLVNGGSIVQLETVEKVEYFHIELDTHDILLAEGAPAESFVDDQSRGMFHNAQEYAELYPAAAPRPAAYCAPRVEAGEELQAVRARLVARAASADAGGEPANALPAPLRGYLDEAEAGRISGWAHNPDAPDERVRVAILDNGVTIAELVADLYRPDLAEAGMGDGRHAFALIPPRPLDPRVHHVVQARRASDGRELGLSPRIIEPVTADAPPGPMEFELMEPEPPGALPHPPEPSRPWEGYLDDATRERLRGWAREPDADEPVSLLVLDNGKQIARVVANMYREDLERLGIGRGRHGFDLLIPGGLSPLARHVVEIRRESDGATLHGAPAVIEPETSFGAALERAVARAVEAVADGERERVLNFLAEQAERLRQLRADTEGERHPREAARRLRRRWGPEAERHGLAEPGHRALVIDARVPRPDRDAGSQALLSHMRALGRLGYAVSFVAADEMAHTDANAAGEGVLCCRAPFYASVEEVLRRQADCFDVVYMHRATIAQRYLAMVRQHMPRARAVYSVADLHWLRLERQAAAEDLPELLPESRRLRFIECTSAWMADAVITHSAHEAALLRAAVPAARVHCVPWEVPAKPMRPTFAERRGVAFIGHYGHVPNQDAAYWLVQDIMPRVWQSDPDIACLLVGSDMPEAIRALARPGVKVLGHVEDLAPIHAEVRLTAATLRYGAGVKGKVLNSFAAGVPCVMSPMAAEGLGLPPPLDRLVGSDPDGLAALICRLHADQAAHAVAVRAGLAFIRKQHGATAVDAALRAAIEDNAPRVRPAAPVRASSAAG